jgi:hypothetical protein
MTRFIVPALFLLAAACGGSTPPANQPEGSGLGPDQTTGPGAAERSEDPPLPGDTTHGTEIPDKSTGGTGVTPNTGSVAPPGQGTPGPAH